MEMLNMVKNEIVITNFGPIEKAELDLNKDFQILIGAQASGKSTICKMVYFCQKIKDYTLDFLTTEKQFTENHPQEYFANYLKYLTKQFMGCFGKTTHMQKFNVLYQFADHCLNIFLNSDGYVRFRFDADTKNVLEGLCRESADVFLNKLNKDAISMVDNISTRVMMRLYLSNTLNNIFCLDRDVIYIPAGRSLLATMSEQLQDVSVREMDLTMQEFIQLIRKTKNVFGSKLPEMVKDYTKTVKGQVNNSALDRAYELIKKILKADYTSESDGEKIYFDGNHWVKLMYSSSGQQEALWILMLIFAKILENKKTFLVIEEPEAHLFPIAQKDIMSLIALFVNTTGSSVIITTHSPYILTSANILLYSDKVESSSPRNKHAIIPKNLRLSYERFAAYQVGGTEHAMVSLLDEESHMVDTSYIDEVSAITNAELEQLITREMEKYDLQ